MSRIRYTEEQKIFMQEFCRGRSHKEIRDEFNRRFQEQITADQVKSYLANHHLSTGRTGWFEKGHMPPNKGKRVSPEAYRKMQRTMFTPGHIPGNTDPIGTEKVLDDGYIWVKVNDVPKAKKQVNWIQKHRLIWQQEHGPIPEGHLIIFLDGDRTNITIENLACVSKADHTVMNHLNLRSRDPELTKAGITVARIVQKQTERKKNKQETL